MNIVRRIANFVMLGFVINLSAFAADLEVVAPEEVGLSSERLERLTRAMESGVEKEHFPGAVGAIARKGKIVYFETYGDQDWEAGVAMEKDTIFRMASMTKAITGVAVMMLFEEGRLSLSDPIERYIPAFKDAQVAVGAKKDWGKKGKKDSSKQDKKEGSDKDKKEWSDDDKKAWAEKAKADESTEAKTVPANRAITIRDLLRHTAGLPYSGSNFYKEGMDLGAMIDALAALPLSTQPGSAYEYGLSMDVLARLVEVVSGERFDVFIKERIFDPLGMNDTGFYVRKEDHDRLVKMYDDAEKGSKIKGKKAANDPYLSPPVILMGGTGLVSTTMDYLRFCQMLLNNGELDGKRLLGRKSVELMHANHLGDIPVGGINKIQHEFRFGLTFGVKPDPGDTGELGSEGTYYWGGAYGTSFWIDPAEDLIGVFMVNGPRYDEDDPVVYSQLFEHFAYQAIVD